MMTHQGTKTLETERLILRPVRIEDAEKAFRNWTHDSEVTKYLTWKPHKDVEETKAVFKMWSEQYADDYFYQWLILIKESDEPIGTISVVSVNEGIDSLSVGYCIGKRWWHQGYTSEALSKVISFLFEEVHANRIEASHDTENPNSGKVMSKCGMIFEGILRDGGRNNRGIIDKCLHAILAKDYFKGE